MYGASLPIGSMVEFYLHRPTFIRSIFMLNVGKYTKPMEPLGPGGVPCPYQDPGQLRWSSTFAQDGAFLTGCLSAVNGITLENLHGTPKTRQSISKGNVILQRIPLNHFPDSVFFRLYFFFDGSLKRDGDDRQHLSKNLKKCVSLSKNVCSKFVSHGSKIKGGVASWNLDDRQWI